MKQTLNEKEYAFDKAINLVLGANDLNHKKLKADKQKILSIIEDTYNFILEAKKRILEKEVKVEKIDE